MNALILGGSSGLGLELAKQLLTAGYSVHVTGRTNPSVKGLTFHALNLSGAKMVADVEKLIKSLPDIDLLVHAAGFYQEGRITDLTNQQIEDMLNVGGRSLLYVVRAILQKQEKLDTLLVITSSSQWVPRKLEPVYNFVKAGAGHFANSLAEDGRINKVLVDGQFGMQTPFWRDMQHPDWDKMLDPTWVAEQLMGQLQDNYTYRFIKIHRDPGKVEEIETR